MIFTDETSDRSNGDRIKRLLRKLERVFQLIPKKFGYKVGEKFLRGVIQSYGMKMFVRGTSTFNGSKNVEIVAQFNSYLTYPTWCSIKIKQYNKGPN